MAKRRFSTFSISFLDIMSCGFGAVILIFLIIEHDVSSQLQVDTDMLQSEVNLLEQEVSEGQASLVEIKNTLSVLNQEYVQTSGLARRVNDEIDAVRNKIAILDEASDDQQIRKIKERLKTLTVEKKKLEDEIAKGNNARRFVGEADRQYLTGLKLGGARILILMDVSASMLDDSIVNVIRRRNMSQQSKRQADKWIRAVRAVEWLIAKLPIDSQFQLFIFNTEVKALVSSSKQQWLNVSDQEKLNMVVNELHKIVPAGGTSLEKAFRDVRQLSPLPDNILLLTDGLPTQGMQASRSNTISGPEREQLFNRAVSVLPDGIPVNILLWPMEGDPMAASAFWKLALRTSGSFMSPSRDWP
ncbi:vWA domain-containing protein [Thalassotalea aquiviva]|uniref:vWA domain-containing protein n=1 Tax=Thalassotalea aquiviva TaxID=3242415 RepID=UPI00352A1956